VVHFVESTISLGIQIIVLGLLIGAIFLKQEELPATWNRNAFCSSATHNIYIHRHGPFLYSILRYTKFSKLCRYINHSDTRACFRRASSCAAWCLACQFLAPANKFADLFQKEAHYGFHNFSVVAGDSFRRLSLLNNNSNNLKTNEPFSDFFILFE
jgi:hypothetical protein